MTEVLLAFAAIIALTLVGAAILYRRLAPNGRHRSTQELLRMNPDELEAYLRSRGIGQPAGEDEMQRDPRPDALTEQVRTAADAGETIYCLEPTAGLSQAQRNAVEQAVRHLVVGDAALGHAILAEHGLSMSLVFNSRPVKP